jgi:hypothetical protein
MRVTCFPKISCTLFNDSMLNDASAIPTSQVYASSMLLLSSTGVKRVRSWNDLQWHKIHKVS